MRIRGNVRNILKSLIHKKIIPRKTAITYSKRLLAFCVCSIVILECTYGAIAAEHQTKTGINHGAMNNLGPVSSNSLTNAATETPNSSQFKFMSSSGTSTLNGIGRGDNFSSFFKYTETNSGTKVENLTDYSKAWTMFESEVNNFYNELKDFNSSASSNDTLGVGTKLLANGRLGDDSTKLTTIKSLGEAYDKWVSSAEYKPIFGMSVDGSLDYNKLKQKMLKIEYSALKVQTLGGIILRADLITGDKSTEPLLDESTKKALKLIQEIDKSNEKNISTLSTSLEGIDSTQDIINSYMNDPYIIELMKDKNKLKTITKAFDTIDLWSINPWTFVDESFVYDDKEYSYVLGAGGFYSYLLNEYRVGQGLVHNIASIDGKVTYPSATGLPSIVTQYSQINYLRNVSSTFKSPSIDNVFGGIFSQEPKFDKHVYLEETYKLDESRNSIRIFATGLSPTTDGVDIMDNYYITLLSIASKDSFIKVMKERYGYDVDTKKSTDGTTSDDQALKDAMGKWIQDEKDLYLFSLNQLTEVGKFYEQFGISKYSTSDQNLVSGSLDFINGFLKDAGYSQLLSDAIDKSKLVNDDVLNINNAQDSNIVRDFVEEVNGAYYLNGSYNELLAWTACFVPFQTNLYEEGSNTTLLTPQAKAKYLKYSRLRQPVSMAVNSNGIYGKLLSNSTVKLEYCTLADFIDAIELGDVFLFTNALSSTDLENGTITSTINTETTSTELPNNTSSNSTDSTSTTDSNSSTETEVTKQVEITAKTAGGDEQVFRINTSNLSTSSKYFGPIYASSNNPNYSSQYDFDELLNNTGLDLFSISTIIANPNMARLIITDAVKVSPDTLTNISSTTSGSQIKTAKETEENKVPGVEDTATTTKSSTDSQESYVNYSMSTLLTSQITPQSLYWNYVLMHNTLEDKNHLSSGLRGDMQSLLYVDFLGNIITESGYVVVPAAANSTRYTDYREYPLYNAMFLNSYPDVKLSSTKIVSLNESEKNKIMLSTKKKGNEMQLRFIKMAEDSSDFYDMLTLYDGDLNTTAGGVYSVYETVKRLMNTTGYVSVVSDTHPLSIMSTKGTESKSFDEGAVSYDATQGILTVNFMSDRTWFKGKNTYIRAEDEVGSAPEILVYAPKSNYPTINMAISGVVGKAFLDSIPPDGYSYEWLALLTLNNNQFTRWREDGAVISEITPDKTKSNFINLNSTVGLLASVKSGSEDTAIYDYRSKSAGEKLKEDPILYTFGTLFESLYVPFIGEININELLYVPTLENTTLFENVSLYIIPVVVSIMLIICIILVFMLATFSLKSSHRLSVTDLACSFLVTLLIAAFMTRYFSTTVEFMFSHFETKMTQDELLIQALYELEAEDKQDSHVFYTDGTKMFSSRSELVLDRVSKEQALEYRSGSGRPEIDYSFYMPLYDNSRQEIVSGIYLKNYDIKINTSDLLDVNSINLIRTDDNQLELYHNPGSDSSILGYYTPYFHLCEGIVDTLNTYNQNTTNSYKLLNYSGITKTTGRAEKYFDSIFFIAGDKLIPYMQAMQEAYDSGQISLGMLLTDQTGKTIEDMVNPDGTDDNSEKSDNYDEFATKTSTITLRDGTVVNVDAEMIKAYLSVFEKMNGDFEDWLGITRMLYLSDNNSPFLEEFRSEVVNSKWYPNQYFKDKDWNSEKFQTELRQKILRVNNNTKFFIINHMDELSAITSDQNLVKIIALKATMEFNKEFSVGLTHSQYPKMISGQYGNNDFLSKAMYMPYTSVFMSNGDSLSYYLSVNGGFMSLIIATIERFLFLIRLLIRWVAVIVAILSFLALYVNYLFRNKSLGKILSRVCIGCTCIGMLQLFEVAGFKLSVLVANNFSLTVVLVVNLVLGILLFCSQQFIVRIILDYIRVLFIYRKEIMSNNYSGSYQYSKNNFKQETKSYYSPSDNSIEYPTVNNYNTTNTTPIGVNTPINSNTSKMFHNNMSNNKSQQNSQSMHSGYKQHNQGLGEQPIMPTDTISNFRSGDDTSHSVHNSNSHQRDVNTLSSPLSLDDLNDNSGL